MSRPWREIMVGGLRPEEKIVAVFRVADTRTEGRVRLPFPVFSVAVSESLNGGFWATPNVAVKDKEGNADWIGGFGPTVEDALEDCLRAFLRNIGDRDDLRDEDFFWSLSSMDRNDGRTYAAQPDPS